MHPSNFHTHTRFSDGTGEPREYVQAAVASGMRALGFSEHAPLPFPSKWNIAADALPAYAVEVAQLKREFAGRIELYLGLEADFIPGIVSPSTIRNQFRELVPEAKLDYLIGSVHYLGQFEDGGFWEVDCRPERFERGLREVFGGNAREMAQEYYCRLRMLLETDSPDVLGHLDVVKVNNRDDRLFSEDAPWYREQVEAVLELLKKGNPIVELNCGGINKGKITQPCPSPWILKRLRDLGIRVTVSSDAHRPDMVAGGLADGVKLLREIGFEEIWTLGEEGWHPVGI